MGGGLVARRSPTDDHEPHRHRPRLLRGAGATAGRERAPEERKPRMHHATAILVTLAVSSGFFGGRPEALHQTAGDLDAIHRRANTRDDPPGQRRACRPRSVAAADRRPRRRVHTGEPDHLPGQRGRPPGRVERRRTGLGGGHRRGTVTVPRDPDHVHLGHVDRPVGHLRLPRRTHLHLPGRPDRPRPGSPAVVVPRLTRRVPDQALLRGDRSRQHRRPHLRRVVRGRPGRGGAGRLQGGRRRRPRHRPHARRDRQRRRPERVAHPLRLRPDAQRHRGHPDRPPGQVVRSHGDPDRESRGVVRPARRTLLPRGRRRRHRQAPRPLDVRPGHRHLDPVGAPPGGPQPRPGGRLPRQDLLPRRPLPVPGPLLEPRLHLRPADQHVQRGGTHAAGAGRRRRRRLRQPHLLRRGAAELRTR